MIAWDRLQAAVRVCPLDEVHRERPYDTDRQVSHDPLGISSKKIFRSLTQSKSAVAQIQTHASGETSLCP